MISKCDLFTCHDLRSADQVSAFLLLSNDWFYHFVSTNTQDTITFANQPYIDPKQRTFIVRFLH